MSRPNNGNHLHITQCHNPETAAETWLDGQPSELFLSGLQELGQRAEKCIELRGEYAEENPSSVAVACYIPGRAKDLSARPRINSSWLRRSIVHTRRFILKSSAQILR
jgi:hypothetical protein